MSWHDFYRRRDALAAVLRHAERDPEGDLPFENVPDVPAVFGGRAELLLALHYAWSLKLTGRVGLAQATAERDLGVDRVDAVIAAWHETATEFAVLRRVLDTHANAYDDVLRPVVESEQRVLALAAGLAEPNEPTAEITRVGAALLALARSAPPQPAVCRRRPVQQLLRRLVASA